MIFTVISIFICLLFSSQLSHLFDMSMGLYYFAIALAGTSVFYILTTSALRGLNRMLEYSIILIIYGGIIFLSFIAFILKHQYSFKSMIYPMLIAYVVITIIITVLFLRKLVKWNYDSIITGLLLKYTAFATIGGLSYTFYSNIDNIMIKRYLNVAEVGIYSAYGTASITVTGVIFSMFNMVYFPTISMYKNKMIIFNRVNKFIPYLIILGIPFILLCELIVLKFFGDQYPLNILWMILAAVGSIGMVIEGIYAWTLSADGSTGAIMSTIGAIIIAMSNVGLNVILIPKNGISGALVSIIVSFSAGTIIIFYFGKKHFTRSEVANR